MASFETYRFIQRVTPTPGGAGGEALNDNFSAIADRLDAPSAVQTLTPSSSAVLIASRLCVVSSTSSFTSNLPAIATAYHQVHIKTPTTSWPYQLTINSTGALIDGSTAIALAGGECITLYPSTVWNIVGYYP